MDYIDSLTAAEMDTYMQDKKGLKRLTALASQVLGQYDLHQPTVEFLCMQENVFFRVASTTSDLFALRTHPVERFGVRTNPAAIETEVQWLLALCRDTDLVVPEPVSARDASLIQVIEDPDTSEERYCVLFHWVPGEFLDKELTPAHLNQVGTLTAELHVHATEFAKSVEIHRWTNDWGWLLSPWIQGRHEIKAWLSEGNLSILTAAAEKLMAEIQQLRRDEDFGLIHADLNQWNYL